MVVCRSTAIVALLRALKLEAISVVSRRFGAIRLREIVQRRCSFEINVRGLRSSGIYTTLLVQSSATLSEPGAQAHGSSCSSASATALLFLRRIGGRYAALLNFST